MESHFYQGTSVTVWAATESIRYLMVVFYVLTTSGSLVFPLRNSELCHVGLSLFQYPDNWTREQT